MANANQTCVSFCNQPKTHYLATSRRYVVALQPFCGCRHLATSRESKAHFGFPCRVRPWDNRGKYYMDGKRIQCWSNASHHVPIYLQPFTSYSEILVGNCRRAAACCTQCVFSARTAHQPRLCTTSSMPLSSRGLSTPRRHGLACVQPLIARVSTRCCVAASGSATATTTCRPSPTCSAPRMTSSSAESHQTPLTSCIRTCPTRLTFPINSEPDLTA